MTAGDGGGAEAEGARALVEWLLGDALQREHMAGAFAHAATTELQDPKNVGLIAFYREDALKLAERARYR